MPVSVVIPTLNEEVFIAPAIEAAFAAGADEVIVCDAGSTDRTLEIAASLGARLIPSESQRARRLNLGAAQARNAALIFLHADTLLPAGAADAVEQAIAAGYAFGGFRLEFIESARRLRFVAFMINARTRITRAPWGDQAQFASKQSFLAGGGYPDYPIMEDYELARRMKRRGPTSVLPLAVRTSGRRFLQKGVALTAALNWIIIAAYHLGVSPDRLARWYRTPTAPGARSS